MRRLTPDGESDGQQYEYVEDDFEDDGDTGFGGGGTGDRWASDDDDD